MDLEEQVLLVEPGQMVLTRKIIIIQVGSFVMGMVEKVEKETGYTLEPELLFLD